MTDIKLPTEFFEYPKLIREHHLDTYGHINNATYMELLEEARWEYITQNGWGWHKVQETKIGPVVLESNIKFKKEIGNRERIVIKTRLVELGEVVGKLEQIIEKSDGKVACESLFTFGLFDLNARKLIAPPAEWIQAISGKGSPK